MGLLGACGSRLELSVGYNLICFVNEIIGCMRGAQRSVVSAKRFGRSALHRFFDTSKLCRAIMLRSEHTKRDEPLDVC